MLPVTKNFCKSPVFTAASEIPVHLRNVPMHTHLDHAAQENELGRAISTHLAAFRAIQTLRGWIVGISSLSRLCSTCRFASPRKPPEKEREGGKKQYLSTGSLKFSEVSFPFGLSRREEAVSGSWNSVSGF